MKTSLQKLLYIKTGRRPRGQMSEAFLTAAFLSLSGGLQEFYQFFIRGAFRLIFHFCLLHILFLASGSGPVRHG